MSCWAAPWMQGAFGISSPWRGICFLIAVRAFLSVSQGKVPPLCWRPTPALLEPDIAGVIAINPPSSHMDTGAPQFLNVLRVCDIPDVFGMLAPRPLTLQGYSGEALMKVTRIYASAGASEKLIIRSGTDGTQ